MREYKGPMVWTDNLTKAKITRTILAMSNTRDGGVIVVGMKEKSDKKFEPVGLSESEASTFNHDDMATHVRDYADPYVDFMVRRIDCDDRDFVLIQVKEFDEIPVICGKDGVNLRKGAIYHRSRTKNESAEVFSQSEMREIIEIATDKAVRKFLSRAEGAGLLARPVFQDHRAMFAKQMEDLP